jgi:hypothetical protein
MSEREPKNCLPHSAPPQSSRFQTLSLPNWYMYIDNVQYLARAVPTMVILELYPILYMYIIQLQLHCSGEFLQTAADDRFCALHKVTKTQNVFADNTLDSSTWTHGIRVDRPTNRMCPPHGVALQLFEAHVIR